MAARASRQRSIAVKRRERRPAARSRRDWSSNRMAALLWATAMTAPDDILAWLASLPTEWTSGCPEPIFLEAREAHRSPGRHYHTWDHVLDCVGKLRTMPCKAPRVALLALVFHDAVYVAGRKDNEAQSANL